MNIQSAISREIFVPNDEKLLVAIEVRRRMKRKGLSFLNANRKRDYSTFLCLSGNVSLLVSLRNTVSLLSYQKSSLTLVSM